LRRHPVTVVPGFLSRLFSKKRRPSTFFVDGDDGDVRDDTPDVALRTHPSPEREQLSERVVLQVVLGCGGEIM
jgi:hypothetical protein